MIGVALKGLLGRKLRAALTAVAIVLGVAMISGTYVLTDTIKAAFGTVFTQVYKNTDAVITGKSAIGGNDEQRRPAAVVPGVAARRSAAACPGVARRAGRHLRPGAARRSRRQGHLRAAARRISRSASTRHGDQRFNPLALVERHVAGRPDRVAIDAKTASSEALQGRRHDRRHRARAGAAVQRRRHREVRRRRVARRRDDGDLRLPDGAEASSTRRASSTRSASPRKHERLARGSSSAQIQPLLPADGAGADGPGRRRSRRRRTRTAS